MKKFELTTETKINIFGKNFLELKHLFLLDLYLLEKKEDG